ncbi:fasciclin domain-containing protein [Methanocella arvoryzae]|uniref:FAS1 domain-containing protein n=1 Tax=Methanocella arvoryzae (strain DSM 22066 / NBRC 105507 / MRE50) TaxID=351160 RepID=Q0W8K7_METAR|nr:fasciclin domain-containing protein [Methanocella arvoryzae]CAH04823.1 hypothetical protein orf23 [uncultured archaeon]CAJ35286.1 conserved hypothetical protein [Methanocella arvoryzae MRE50]
MLKTRKIVAILALVAILLAFAAPAVAQRTGMQQGMQQTAQQKSMIPMQSSNKDMMATMSDMKEASMAATMMKAAGMDTMMSSGSHTLFVPGDSAMKKMGSGSDLSKIGQMTTDKSMATNVMKGFIMDKSVMPSEMTDGKTLTMMNGKTMTVKNVGGQMTLDGAKITKAVQTTNGMIYMIDSVPSSMMSMPMMSK